MILLRHILRTLEINLVQNKTFSSCVKYTASLLPELEEAFNSGELKHRKHPGITKQVAIKLPPHVIAATDRVMSSGSKSFILQEADKLKKYLHSRRLPIEEEEVQRRIRNIFPSLDDNFEQMQESLTKDQMLRIKKNLSCEIFRWKPLEYSDHQCLLYLVSRLAANYASIMKVFTEIQNKIPEYNPETFFDFGSGVGSALWAANSLWGNSIKEYFCVDASAEMNDLLNRLLSDENADEMIIKPVFFRQFLPASEKIKYDLVVSAFSLLDLPTAKERLRIIDTLWRKTNDILVIIEYGNFAGYTAVMDAREYILKLENGLAEEFNLPSTGAHVISPCPHDLQCPLLAKKLKTPCGVMVSYHRLFPTRNKSDTDKYWISYTVLRKGQKSSDEQSWPRIIKVLSKPKHARCHLCCSDGKLHEFVFTKAKHGRNLYRCARMSSVGDQLPANLKPIEENDQSLQLENCDMDSDNENSLNKSIQ